MNYHHVSTGENVLMFKWAWTGAGTGENKLLDTLNGSSKWRFNELSTDSFVYEITTTAYLGPTQVIFQQYLHATGLLVHYESCLCWPGTKVVSFHNAAICCW